MTDTRAYSFAFHVGAAGCILLILYAAIGNTMAGLSLLSIWFLLSLFVLPWLFLFIQKQIIHIPDWAIRGPHQ